MGDGSATLWGKVQLERKWRIDGAFNHAILVDEVNFALVTHRLFDMPSSSSPLTARCTCVVWNRCFDAGKGTTLGNILVLIQPTSGSLSASIFVRNIFGFVVTSCQIIKSGSESSSCIERNHLNYLILSINAGKGCNSHIISDEKFILSASSANKAPSFIHMMNGHEM